MASSYMEVSRYLFSNETDPTTNLLIKDHVPEKEKQIFNAKTMVSAFTNFEVGCVMKKNKK